MMVAEPKKKKSETKKEDKEVSSGTTSPRRQ
jgi:hypothetical protein